MRETDPKTVVLRNFEHEQTSTAVHGGEPNQSASAAVKMAGVPKLL